MKKESRITKLNFIFILFFIGLYSCIKGDKIKVSSELNEQYEVLNSEIAKHFQIYPNDVEFELSKYLANQAKYHYHFEGYRIDAYTNVLDTTPTELTLQTQRLRELKELSTGIDTISYDILSLTAPKIINHVKKIKQIKAEVLWGDSIPDDILKEYLLPYNISKASFSPWVNYYRNQYFNENDSSYQQLSFKQAVEKIHDWDYDNSRDYNITTWRPNFLHLPNLSLVALDKLQTGTCRHLSMRSCAKLRALGIPAAIDYIPLYMNRFVGHDWVSAILNDSIFIPYDATNSMIGFDKRSEQSAPKIYRKTFSIQNNSHIVQRGVCDFLPPHFNDPYLRDVTALYQDITTVELSVPDDLEKDFAYLALFNAQDGWTPIAWSPIENGLVSFKNMGRKGVYLPVVIDARGMTQISNPLLLDKSGNVINIYPDYKNLIELRLKRKYFLSKRKKTFLNRMIGGCFEGANNADFNNATVLYKITETPPEHSKSIAINNSNAYKYLRYISPPKSHGNVAEVSFWNDNAILTGDVIGTKEARAFRFYTTAKAAFDNKNLTYVDMSGESVWCGLALNKPEVVTEIKFTPRNDINSIQIGNEYELFYWDDCWVSAGRKTATTYELIYKNIPSNALYWVHCHTEGKEEQVFTYENGKQVWW